MPLPYFILGAPGAGLGEGYWFGGTVADIWDSANLLRKCNNEARRPNPDEETVEVDGVTSSWYDLLSEAQDYWVRRIASTYPEALYGPPTRMISIDGGETYYFGCDANGQKIFPIGHVEIRQSRNGRVWVPGADWQSNRDFVLEGTQIRFPDGKKKTFADGPYARFITPPTQISAAVQPVLQPPSARKLLVLRAVIYWAGRGNLRDPAQWERRENDEWNNSIIPMYRTQYHLAGAQAVPEDDEQWWHGIDTGEGYTRWDPS